MKQYNADAFIQLQSKFPSFLQENYHNPRNGTPLWTDLAQVFGYDFHKILHREIYETN